MRDLLTSINRRQLGTLTVATLVGIPLAACAEKSDSDQKSSAASSETKADGATSATSADNKITPVDHPAGLQYGTWLREDSHVLDAGGKDAVLVEFLDFECTSCSAALSTIDEIREKFKGKLTYVVRYFPLNIHPNAKPAAYAAEASARQGKLEPMIKILYQKQDEWISKTEGIEETFKGFAEEIGIADINRWVKDRDSEDVKKRVDEDLNDARELGLTGTPSFYLNADLMEPKSVEDFTQQIEAKIK